MGPLELFPYLFFNNQCAAAMRHYHEVLGGDLTVRLGRDMPGVPEALHEKVLHAHLKFGSLNLYASDWMLPVPFEKMAGSRVLLKYKSFDEGKKVFDRLAADGGETLEGFVPMPFAEGFGRLNDRFGTRWMVLAGEVSPEARS